MKILIFSFAALVTLATANSMIFAAAAPQPTEAELGLMARARRALRYAQEHPRNVAIGVAAAALAVVCMRRLGQEDLQLRLEKLEDALRKNELRSNPDRSYHRSEGSADWGSMWHG